MNKRGAGVIFCLIASLLFATRYITAAIFGSGLSSWNSNNFNAMLKYIGSPLLILSVISIVIGFTYLIWAEISKDKWFFNKKTHNEMPNNKLKNFNWITIIISCLNGKNI